MLKDDEKNRFKLQSIKFMVNHLETSFRFSISEIENDISALEKAQLAEEGPRLGSPKKQLQRPR